MIVSASRFRRRPHPSYQAASYCGPASGRRASADPRWPRRSRGRPPHRADSRLPLTRTAGRTVRINSIGVGSSKMTTRSTASSAANTSARALWSWTGRSRPFSLATEASLLSPTINLSQAARAATSSRMWPGCKRSKQPLVKPMRIPSRRHCARCCCKHTVVDENLLLVGPDCGGKKAGPQFSQGDGRRAALADSNGGGGVSSSQRRLELRAHGQERRQYGDHRIACARHVAYTDRVCRNVKSALAALVKAHTVLTARHHHRGALREVSTIPLPPPRSRHRCRSADASPGQAPHDWA